MTTQTLLIELLTEELPPKALNNLGNHFAASVAEGLEKAQLIDGAAEYTAYASPRRLAVQVKNVKAVQADQKIVKKGPTVANAMKDGAPTKALEGFARGAGAKIEDLTIVHDDKQDVYAYEYVQTGKPLGELLEDIINAAVKKLPIPKVMLLGQQHIYLRSPCTQPDCAAWRRHRKRQRFGPAKWQQNIGSPLPLQRRNRHWKCRQLRRTNARARQSGSIVCRTQSRHSDGLERAGRPSERDRCRR